jgi:hypothetical protein
MMSRVAVQRSAAMLRVASDERISLPSYASFRTASVVGLSGFSAAKYTNDRIEKNVVYMVNQKEPFSRPFCFIWVVMWMMLRDTFTYDAAHA